MGGISTAFQRTRSAIVTLLTITLSPLLSLVLPPSLSVVQTDLISLSLSAGWLLSLPSPLVCNVPPSPPHSSPFLPSRPPSLPPSLYPSISLSRSLPVSSYVMMSFGVSASCTKLDWSCRDSQCDTRNRHRDMSCAVYIQRACKSHYKRAVNIRPPQCSVKMHDKICRQRQPEMWVNQIKTDRGRKKNSF